MNVWSILSRTWELWREGLTICMTSASLPNLVSRIMPVLQRWLQCMQASSMVFNIMPRLSRHDGLEGELTNRSDLFSRSLNWLRGIDASEVSISAVSRLIDICRFDLHPTALTPGPMDSVLMLWGVSVWLCPSGVLLVSHFNFWRLADSCRYELDSSTLTSTFNESEQMLWRLDRWPRQHRYVPFIFCIWTFMLTNFSS